MSCAREGMHQTRQSREEGIDPMREEHDEPHAVEADASGADHQDDDTDEAPRSAKTRVGSNVPNAADDGGEGTHE